VVIALLSSHRIFDFCFLLALPVCVGISFLCVGDSISSRAGSKMQGQGSKIIMWKASQGKASLTTQANARPFIGVQPVQLFFQVAVSKKDVFANKMLISG